MDSRDSGRKSLLSFCRKELRKKRRCGNEEKQDDKSDGADRAA